ncbi:Crp/Fnr family transcriptional regulator [Flammeovirga agarivorans]|uniref:Crp/Fnr family transcriptional regulator n=1 Tax=Flammeovirga agarivorans TaxID=2726742 RepID=A0A7X8SIJ6_9BACT|nr:Crp/Fnr family transcriptional regulator [Flammeovirga agarivorans]NLR90896.1 Crp/Fnr family transcriptional regulator [Flammeovirga agarivorans]
MKFKKPDCLKCPVRSLSIFEHVQEDDLVEISTTKGFSNYKKGENIFREGQPALGIYILHNGKVKITKTGVMGREQIVSFARQGEIMGYRPMLLEESYDISAIAIEESTVCFIHKNKILQLIEQDKDFALKLIRTALQSSKKVTEIVSSLSQKTVRSRVAESLLIIKDEFGEDAQGNIDVVLSREDLSAMIGTSSESYIRMIKELIDDEVITKEGKKFKIQDEQTLKRIAEKYDY